MTLLSLPSEDSRGLLQRIAAEVGVELDETRGLDCSSLASIAQSLRTPSQLPRLVELEECSLAHISLPALALLDGTLAVVRKVEARVVELELPRGEQRVLSPREMVTRSRGAGLELGRGLPEGGSFALRLVKLMSTRTRDFATLAAYALASAGIGLATPFASQLVIDRALPERSPKLLSLIALATLFLALQRGAFGWLEQRTAIALHGRIELTVATALFDRLLRIPYQALARENVGSWIETLRGARRAQGLLTRDLLVPLLSFALVFVYALALAASSPQLALGVTVGALLLLGLALAFALRASLLESAVIDASAQQRASLHELMAGMPTIRACGAQERGLVRWLGRLLLERETSLAVDLQKIDGRALTGFGSELVRLVSFLWAAQSCLDGALSVGEMMSLLLLSDRYLTIVVGFSNLLTPIAVARSHFARVDALLAHPEVVSPSQAQPLPESEAPDAVVLDDVWFRYGPDQPYVLQGYSLRIRSLEHFQLRGESGAGKTTVLRLIAGLYVPERGSVRVFGRAPHELRREIGYLPQVVHLFHGSIRDNLSLLSRAPAEAILSASAQSGLAEFIASLPMGYDTVLPSGGTTLSGGQRQLIAWTAAMASGRRLLLLDEALSQVDRVTRARLLRMAKEQQRTIVSVEHESTNLRDR